MAILAPKPTSTMNDFQFDCPKCGQNILAAADWAGRRMTCPSCETRITIPDPTATPKKGRSRPLATEVPPKVRIRVKLPPKTGANPANPGSAKAPASRQSANRSASRSRSAGSS